MLEFFVVLFGTIILLLFLGGITLWLGGGTVIKRVFRDRRKITDTFSPEFLRGNELFYWAKDTAAQIVAKNLLRPTNTSPIDLSRDLHADATRAMFPLGVEQDCDLHKFPCPEQGQGMIGITPPEALEVADYIQKQLPATERQRIHDLANENVQRLRNINHAEFDGARTPCPLQGADGVCLAYAARPLRCRPLHAATVWKQRQVSRPVNAECDYDEQLVEQGAETGLTESLAAAGRDGSIYELNGALLVALDTPNAAERWAKGEDVFKQCKRYR